MSELTDERAPSANFLWLAGQVSQLSAQLATASDLAGRLVVENAELKRQVAGLSSGGNSAQEETSVPQDRGVAGMLYMKCCECAHFNPVVMPETLCLRCFRRQGEKEE